MPDTDDPLGEFLSNAVPEDGEYIKLGPDVELGFIAEQDRHHVDGRNPFDPEAWVAKGFVRNWGDAAVMTPWFEVLRRGDDRSAEFVVLCPTFLRRPLRFYFGGAWGSY